MATVTTTLTLTQEFVPYVGDVGTIREYSPVAAGELRVFDYNETIAATAAGDNQEISATAALPQNRAYVLLDIYARLLAASGNDVNFTDSLDCTLTDAALAADTKFAIDIPLWSRGQGQRGAGNRGFKTYVGTITPGAVIIPQGGEQVELELNGYNATANDGAYAFNFFARFLVLLLPQAFHFQVNNPTVVRA